MYSFQAHGLANFCVAKDNREIRSRLVYDIETSWYKGDHPLSYCEFRERAREHKQLLKDLREKTREEFDGLRLLEMDIDLTNVFETDNIQAAQHLAEMVFTKSTTLCRNLVTITKAILQCSVETLAKDGKSPPCDFAVIGLGSIAKGEATPYSDLEYAFIVEKHSEYFTELAVDSYFRIGNLGETPLKCFDIEELKASSVSPVTQTVGYRIDGITKKSGNIPTGNGRAEGQSLTLTVEEFMALYQRSAERPFTDSDMAGDISDLLSSTVLIMSNQGAASSLYKNFRSKVRKMLEPSKITKPVAIRRFRSFLRDLEDYNFQPTFNKFQAPTNTDIKIKPDIFRYPTLLANNIKLCMGLKLRHSSDVYAELYDQELLKEDVYQYLRIILGISMYMRVAAYLDYRSQAETVLLTVDLYMYLRMEKKTSILSPRLFVLLGLLLVPIKKSVNSEMEVLKKAGLTSSLADDIRAVIKRLSVPTSQRPNELLLAEIYYFTGAYQHAKMILGKVVGRAFETTSCLKFCKQIKHKFNADTSSVKYVELGCYILYQTEQWTAAIDFLEWLMVNKKEKTTLWKVLSARCYDGIGDLKKSGKLLDEIRLEKILF